MEVAAPDPEATPNPAAGTPVNGGSDSDFGRLVAEEYRRRAQRIIDLGQAAPDTDREEPDGAEDGDDQCDQ
jgi:hypothetical protein